MGIGAIPGATVCRDQIATWDKYRFPPFHKVYSLLQGLVQSSHTIFTIHTVVVLSPLHGSLVPRLVSSSAHGNEPGYEATYMTRLGALLTERRDLLNTWLWGYSIPGGTIPGITGAIPGITMGGAMPGIMVGYMSPIWSVLGLFCCGDIKSTSSSPDFPEREKFDSGVT